MSAGLVSVCKIVVPAAKLADGDGQISTKYRLKHFLPQR
jgi:hypothetical protein